MDTSTICYSVEGTFFYNAQRVILDEMSSKSQSEKYESRCEIFAFLSVGLTSYTEVTQKTGASFQAGQLHVGK